MSFVMKILAIKELPKGLSTFEVLGGAYKFKNEDKYLTHTCETDEEGFATKVLCGKVKLDSIANDLAVATQEFPTCKYCLAKLKTRGLVPD